jgi:hypothetical protein
LPELGDFRVVHTRFSRWAKRGVWKKLFEHLAQDADNEYAMIDSTIVRAHQHSAGALKKGLRASQRAQQGRPEHQDSHYRPRSRQSGWISSPGGQACDLEGADVLLPQLDADILLATRASTPTSAS